jgi:tRNA (guanosine-2'-O-)-methyltransferase
LFEWAQSKMADYCRANGLAYPPMDEDGELLDGLGWQLAVREGRAPKG